MQRAGRLELVGVASATLLAATALAFAPVPAGGPKEEKIVFTTVTGEGKTVGIAIMDPDGGKRTVLTKGDAMEMDPALSPDGKRIAFVVISPADHKSAIWVMKADGSDRKQLLENKDKGVVFSPCWSPDGRKIAYSQMAIEPGAPPTEADLMVVDADGKNAKPLAQGLIPAWSPDGKKILYSVIDKAGGFEPALWVMDADGKNAKELVKGRALMGAWSPDGKKIAYTAAEEGARGQPHVYVCNADGSDAKQLTKGAEEGELAPRWSADGKRVYFSRLPFKGPREKASIFAVDADGSNEKALGKGDGMDLLGGAPLFLLARGEARKP